LVNQFLAWSNVRPVLWANEANSWDVGYWRKEEEEEGGGGGREEGGRKSLLLIPLTCAY